MSHGMERCRVGTVSRQLSDAMRSDILFFRKRIFNLPVHTQTLLLFSAKSPTFFSATKISDSVTYAHYRELARKGGSKKKKLFVFLSLSSLNGSLFDPSSSSSSTLVDKSQWSTILPSSATVIIILISSLPCQMTVVFAAAAAEREKERGFHF